MNTWEKLQERLAEGRYTLVMARNDETPDDDATGGVLDATEGLSADDIARYEQTLDDDALTALLQDDIVVMKLSVFDGVRACYVYSPEADEGRANLLPEDCDGFEDGHLSGLPAGWWPIDDVEEG